MEAAQCRPMLVYGDIIDPCEPGAQCELIRRMLALAVAQRSVLERHAAWVTLLIEAGRLLQGIADAELEERGVDEHTVAQQVAADLTLPIAYAVSYSWHRLMTDGRSGGSTFARAELSCSAHGPDVESVGAALVGLERLRLPPKLMLRQPEGFAFYALYPELYLEAAKHLALASSAAARCRAADTQLIGLRSIGTALAPIAAAALGGRRFHTVRPVGDPFRRRLALSRALEQELLAAKRFAIIDEGPGLSGSSFGAVADFLEQRGVSRRSIHVLPSHPGDAGPHASAEHRSRWREIERQVIRFEDLLLPNLLRWIEPLVGTISRWEDFSGGAWRAHLYESERAWPPANPQQERRKYLVHAERGTFLVKFAGLAGVAEEKLAMLQALHAAGFTPAPVAAVHGFIVEEWVEAKPLDTARVGRSALVERMGAYLRFRAGQLGRVSRGASIRQLFEMLRTNLAEGLGNDAARATQRFEAHLGALERAARPVPVDARLHAWEWLLTPEGALLKSDAVDHHAGHDLIGCQDISWDLAGAEVEHELSARERAALFCSIEPPVSSELLSFMRLAYAAFQLGLCALGAKANPVEAKRLGEAAARYAQKLGELLGAICL